ncbi:MAG: alpha/beta fold hydrolase, partial [Dehalococcoidia bacterium]
MAWREGDIEVDGVRLHYYRRGSGPPVVLAHGATDNGLCWTRVAEEMERDYDVIAYDARFHGLSDAPEEASGGGGADLLGLVEQLGLERPALIGHSMGAGSVAAAAAERSDLFCCVILEDPGWRTEAPQRPPPPDYRSMTPAEIEAAGRERSPMWHDAEFGPWALAKQQYRPPPAQSRPPLGAWRETVAAITCPALLITGGNRERGAIVTPEAAAEAQRLCPRLEVVCFEDAGHN